jgi:hypothetical protein
MTADDPCSFSIGDLVLGPSGRAARIVRLDAGEATIARLDDGELITLRLRWLLLVEKAHP